MCDLLWRSFYNESTRRYSDDGREPMTLLLKHPRGLQKQKRRQIFFGWQHKKKKKSAKQKNEVGCISTEEEAINSGSDGERLQGGAVNELSLEGF